jgi:hypothetical protein
VLVVVSAKVHAEQNTLTENAIGVTQKTRVPKLTMKGRKDTANKDKNMLKLNTIYWGIYHEY